MQNDFFFLASVGAVYFLLAASPGPNFVLITHTAASQGRRTALLVSFGVSTASVWWAGMAAMGLGVLIHRFGEAYRYLQVAGGLYLLYLGWKMLRATPSSSPGHASLPSGAVEAYRRGLLSNLGNPKSLAFFGSAFASLFTPDQPAALQWAAVGVVGAISIGWNALVVMAFSNPRVQAGYHDWKQAIDRCCGGLLGLLGLRLITDR